MFGERKRCRSTKSGDEGVGMKKQPMREKKNREVGGSSPKKEMRHRKKEVGTDRDTTRKVGVEISGASICAVFQADFGRDTTHPKFWCVSRIGVLNRFVRVLIKNDPLENLSS